MKDAHEQTISDITNSKPFLLFSSNEVGSNPKYNLPAVRSANEWRQLRSNIELTIARDDKEPQWFLILTHRLLDACQKQQTQNNAAMVACPSNDLQRWFTHLLQHDKLLQEIDFGMPLLEQGSSEPATHVTQTLWTYNLHRFKASSRHEESPHQNQTHPDERVEDSDGHWYDRWNLFTQIRSYKKSPLKARYLFTNFIFDDHVGQWANLHKSPSVHQQPTPDLI